MSGESIEDVEEKGDEEREDLGERMVSGRDMAGFKCLVVSAVGLCCLKI